MVNLTLWQLKAVKLEEGALGKSVRSALQTHSVRAPSGCAKTFVCGMGGVTDATETVSKSKVVVLFF